MSYSCRGEGRNTKFAIDTPDKLVHDLSKVLILLDVAATGNRNLNQHDFSDPLGVLVQKHLQGVELLRHSLDVIETVNANDELDALKLAL